jgi:hypothetical protein
VCLVGGRRVAESSLTAPQSSAGSEVLGGMSGIWDERAAGTPGDDAPVGGYLSSRWNLPNHRIRDPYVRGMGGGRLCGFSLPR